MIAEILKMIHYFRKSSYKLFGLKLIHLILTLALFFIFFLVFHYNSTTGADEHFNRFDVFTCFVYLGILLFFYRTYNAYLLGYARIKMLVFGQFLSQCFSVAAVYLIVSIVWNHFKSPVLLIPMLACQLILDVIWSMFANDIFFKLSPKHKTLMIYRNNLDRLRLSSVNGKPIKRIYEDYDELQFNGTFHELQDKLKGYDTVFVAGLNSRCRNGLLKYCKEYNIHGYFLPHIGDTIMQDAEHITTFDTPVLHVGRKEVPPEVAFTKRVFDIIFSGLALVIFSPLIGATALAVKMSDGGPAFYKQTRLTRDGKEFKIIKFRSMRVDAEKDGVARLSKGDNDDRVTPVGKIIRRWRLDEIPQLINVFRGEMSIVGPRPERPEIAETYYEKLPAFKLRLQVKAGITGYAQVYGKYNTPPYEKLEFDLLYINNMNLLTDLQLIFATFLSLFREESVEGVEGITADEIDQEHYYSDTAH